MQIEVLMPKMGESITEGRIIKWHKRPGEKVERDEVLLEISTDKVDTEIPSSAKGVISKILVAEQETVQVGSVIALIETSESPVEVSGAASVHGNDQSEVVAQEASSQSTRTASPPALKAPHGRNGDRFYSPVVRRMADAEGITADELTEVSGTGAGGRVRKEDLQRYLQSRPTVSSGEEPARPQESLFARAPQSGGREQLIPMDNMRQRIMEHMVESRDTSVHVAAITEADLSKISEYISRHAEAFVNREGFKLTFMPFIAHACVKALKDFPLVNSSIVKEALKSQTSPGNGANIAQHNYVNLGIAVAIETTGLLVPVIKGADEKNILGLARAIHDLAARARTKRLTGDDTIGSTFSITNYGVFGNLIGVPIINQPNVAILGVGAVKKRPVVINDAIAIRHMGFLTLSFDHRLIDGALGGRFLERIVYYLENSDTKQLQ